MKSMHLQAMLEYIACWVHRPLPLRNAAVYTFGSNGKTNSNEETMCLCRKQERPLTTDILTSRLYLFYLGKGSSSLVSPAGLLCEVKRQWYHQS